MDEPNSSPTDGNDEAHTRYSPLNSKSSPDDAMVEIAVEVDSEAAEAVAELFNRFNGGGYDEDNQAGEAGGGGAIIEATDFVDDLSPLEGPHRLWVKTYIKPGSRGEQIRRKIEEGLWYLSTIYPIPEAQIRTVRQEDWAHAWKKFYKPIRIGKNVLLKPIWEETEIQASDIVIELEPGMAFGTGMHPTTRLCIAAIEETLGAGDSLLDIGTGSGILSVLAAKLGACPIHATDIDPIAVAATLENMRLNGISTDNRASICIEQGSVPKNVSGQFDIVVANILAEVIVKLFNAAFDNVPLAEPLSPTGTMILSGILEEKIPMVEEALEKQRLKIVDIKQEGDWVALLARHR